MKVIFIIISFLIAAIFSSAHASSYNSAVQRLYSPQLIDAIIKEQIRKHPMRTPSLNGGNSTVESHENDFRSSKATSRERVQIAVSGVHQPIPQYAPEQKPPSLGEIVLPKKQITLADADRILEAAHAKGN